MTELENTYKLIHKWGRDKKRRGGIPEFRENPVTSSKTPGEPEEKAQHAILQGSQECGTKLGQKGRMCRMRGRC